MSAYRIPFSVDFHAHAGSVTPLRMAVDFSEFLASGKLVDPHTVKVVRAFGHGKQKGYQPWFSEDLYYGNRGLVAFAVEEPEKACSWELLFQERGADGTLAPFPQSMPPAGVGDELLLNSGRWQPIAVPGMHPFPMAVDWDSNGKTDVLSTSHYSNAQNMPWAGVFVFRNIGEEEAPRFSTPYRLRANGVDETDNHSPLAPFTFPARNDFISEYYLHADVFPWFSEHRHDLVTISAQSPYIKVYRNTGEKDGAGLPRLDLALKFLKPRGIEGYIAMRVIDWDGTGRPSLVLGAAYRTNERIVLLRNLSENPGKIDFREVPMRQGCSDREFTDGRPWHFDLHDIDGDGELELITTHILPPAGPIMKVYKNGGSRDCPRWYDIGNMECFRHHTTFNFRFVDTGPFSGILVGSVNGGWGIHYLERNTAQSDFLAPDAYTDRGPLTGEGVKLRAEGYTTPFPCDLDGNGGTDLVLGDEPGFVTLAKSTGTRTNPSWEVPRSIQSNGTPLRLYREQMLHDHDGEMWCGQVKPLYVDWDSDGIPDLIVSNTTNKILFFKGLGDMQFAEPQDIEVEGDPFPFGWRKRPFALDWDGNGLMDLVSVDKDERICLFRRTRRDGNLVLLPGEVMRYEDGEEITTNTIPPGIYRNPVALIWVCDYDGDGDWDLLVSSNLQTSLLENTGSTQGLVFKRPVPLSTPDGEINICHHESSCAALDWDADGDLDIIIGGESGSLYFFRRDWLEGREHAYRFPERTPV